MTPTNISSQGRHIEDGPIKFAISLLHIMSHDLRPTQKAYSAFAVSDVDAAKPLTTGVYFLTFIKRSGYSRLAGFRGTGRPLISIRKRADAVNEVTLLINHAAALTP